MNITQDRVASIAYLVTTQEGAPVDQTTRDAPLDYLHGHNNLIPGLEKELEGKTAGDKFSITVSPEDAYGDYEDALVQRVPKEAFQGVDELEVGMRFMAQTEGGQMPVEITAVEDDEVVVDGNHMLAGQTLSFEVEVVAVRDAESEEIEMGQVKRAGCGGGCSSHGGDHECCGGQGDEHECCGGNGDGQGCGCH